MYKYHEFIIAKAAFPQPCSKADKYWPPVTKIDDAFGDRNLVCTCQSWQPDAV